MASSKINPLLISPPLLNSANPWCTTLPRLQALYNHPHTGAVTTRTSLLQGFPHDSSVHQFAFFNPNTLSASEPNVDQAGEAEETASLNTLGYSPLPLEEYLGFVKTINNGLDDAVAAARKKLKPFIISVTGSVEEVVQCYRHIAALQRDVQMPLAMEINLSCPNIPGKPPPAYSSASLLEYLSALKREIGKRQIPLGSPMHVPMGIKTPPYTYHDQFQYLIDALLQSKEAAPTHLPCPLSFITATNTLGSCLLLAPQGQDAYSHSTLHRTINSVGGTGIGGLAGAPLHPLALGNVCTLKQMLLQHRELEHIQVIGVGGVEDIHGYNRMRAVGATAVGIGTALGRKGLRVFEEIGEAIERQ